MIHRKKGKNKNLLSVKFFLLIFLVYGWIFAENAFSAETSKDVDVSTQTKTTVLKDSDGDGLLDPDDPHPDVAEIYIVEDNDGNGVVDSFEKKE